MSEFVKTLTGEEIVNSVVFSPDGSRIVSGSDDYMVKIWNADTGEVERTLKGHKSDVTSVAFSSDGSRITSGSVDYTVIIWNAMNGEADSILFGHVLSLIS